MAAKPKQLPQATQKLISAAAELGMSYWGPALGTGMHWAVNGHREFHAIRTGTRGGATYSHHACGLMVTQLHKEANRISSATQWTVRGFSEDIDTYRDREITRLQLALANPVWHCDVDGPAIVHPATSTAALAQIQMGLGE